MTPVALLVPPEFSKFQGENAIYYSGDVAILLVMTMKRMENLKSVILLLGALACLPLVFSCSNSQSISSGENQSIDVEITADSLQGMLRVSVAKAEVVLGTADEQARQNERPKMKVAIDYSFSVGRHEVTCKEFNALMKDETGLVLDCDNGKLPATNLTYYDAVLFANARSHSEGFDSAYSYTGVVLDAEKHCTNLEGFAFHPEKNAYRLPTEAEWVLAASLNWNPSDGWNAKNSDYRLHDVCTISQEEDMPCDMAGNAMEWVNDWMGFFRDTTLINYVGAPDGGTLGERVVKGGSYRNAASAITLYGRGDVYTVTSSTRADYVGFRLAFGHIPNAVWMGSNGRATQSRVVPLAKASTLYSLTKTYKMKLAFRSDLTGNLTYIDYSSGVLSVVEIPDTLEVFHPEISPDGEKVAFCTGLEGVSGKSAVYVRDLNADGTNLVKLDVEVAAIPRWRVLENGDTAIVYVTSAGNNKEETSFLASSTWQVVFKDGAFGKPEKLFDGAYHGGISEDGTLAVTGARLLRARVADAGSTVMKSATDTVWYDGEQACNASLAKDRSKRTLFLDFGGETGRAFVGTQYDTHERLLVVDSTGALVQSVAAPSGYSFDHSEWVSNNNLAVVTLANMNGSHQVISLVNFSDSSLIDLAEGDELWHPNLWVNKRHFAEGNWLNLDSAGVYLTEEHVAMQSKHRVKMELFWKNLEKNNVLLVGSSRMEMGVNPDMFPEWNMLNLAVPGIDPARDMYFAKNYGLNHSEHLKALAISIDLDNWRGSEDFLHYMLYTTPGYQYDADHNFWVDSIPGAFLEAVENSYPAEIDIRAQITDRGGSWGIARSWDSEPVDVLFDSVFTEEQMNYLHARIDELKSIIDIAAKKNIYVIGIIFPQAPQYKETNALGLYGLQRSVAKKLIDSLDLLSKENKYFVLMDENKMGDHDYTDEMAYNRDHLSNIGAAQLTARLDSVLKTLKW